MRARKRKWITYSLAALAVLSIAALFVPEPEPVLAAPAGQRAFVWGRDPLFARLERDFEATRARGCDRAQEEIASRLDAIDTELGSIEAAPLDPGAEIFGSLEAHVFDVAAQVAACPTHARAFAGRIARLRSAVKRASIAWDPDDRAARETLYRMLYGSRAALEEVLLQAPSGAVPALQRGDDVPSRTPSVVLHGVRLHSGDVLLSRGGAPTSALIARGNDFPGNFSHIALLHVSDDGEPTILEAHIERGLVTSTAQQYLRDTKLRIAVLRLRADHPALAEDPLLPHRAASEALERARRAHVPYDFEMNFRDPSEQFCSEVASAAYAPRGVRLWRGLSSMSGQGLTRWLGSFGVRNFVTLGPSDLEYDAQLASVAEWRDPQTLFSDHLDNAVLDVMLEGAERGDRIGYAHARLPLARIAKGYSAVLNLFGGVGPVPEGMSATTGLRVEWLGERHGAIRAGLETRVRDYRAEHGRRPPYWTLVAMARRSAHTAR
jgi:hypothetical protein